MSDERQELLDEGNELGLEFPSNIPTNKLKNMIAEAKGEPPAIEDDVVDPGPAVKADAEEDQEETPKVEPKSKKGETLTKFQMKRQKIAESKTRALKKQVVTITNKDNRENDFMTTAYLSFENQYFGLSKLVPLDVPVELEIALIKIAETTMMTLHKDEIVDGKRTGNKVPVRTKKFAVSYGKQTDQ